MVKRNTSVFLSIITYLGCEAYCVNGTSILPAGSGGRILVAAFITIVEGVKIDGLLGQ
jgi:hypothetical protein